MEIDPIVLAAFGPPPEGMDLTEDQAVANTVASVVCLFLAIVSMILRLWARSIQGFGIKADDWLIIVALVGFVIVLSYILAYRKTGISVWHSCTHHHGESCRRRTTPMGE